MGLGAAVDFIRSSMAMISRADICPAENSQTAAANAPYAALCAVILILRNKLIIRVQHEILPISQNRTQGDADQRALSRRLNWITNAPLHEQKSTILLSLDFCPKIEGIPTGKCRQRLDMRGRGKKQQQKHY